MMVTARSVPHRPGLRYTFKVCRYLLCQRWGWEVYRVAGSYWHLPPNTFTYWPVEQILRFLDHAESRQRVSFDGVAYCRKAGYTTDATETGIYWTGQQSFQVNDEHDQPDTSFVKGVTGNQPYTGIHVTFRRFPEKDYVLLVDKDVSETTFYKYLLFYCSYVSFRPDYPESYRNNPFPYRKDNRCFIQH